VTSRLIAAMLGVLASLVFSVSLHADEYPSRTVTIIVPYPAGGPTDETARIVAQSMSKIVKENVIIENVTGGGTLIGTNRVAKAAPDGYTLLLHNLQIAANVTLYKELPFDTEKDLSGVMMINHNPLVLVGRNSLAANTLAELLAAMKAGRMRAAIPGYGATGHLVTTLLAQETHAQLDQIPYRGAAPAVTDLLGGHVDLFFGTPQSIVQLVTEGRIKAYGITSKETMARLPTAGSLVTALGPQFNVMFWQGLFAPAATPEPVIRKLNAALQEALSDPAIVQAWSDQNVSTFPNDERSAAAANAMLKDEITRWGKVIRENNIHANQ
jgi:tripartite-type tricarboxylate transporter receptor subunit TctC